MVSVFQFYINAGNKMNIFDFDHLYRLLDILRLADYKGLFREKLEKKFAKADGNFPRWLSACEQLPDISAQRCSLDSDVISVCNDSVDEAFCQSLNFLLKKLCPWRKGPFNLFGVKVDSEWRSDFKFNRIINKISDLSGRNIIDVGCGNGYFMLRFAGRGANAVVGVDPSMLFLSQFYAVSKYLDKLPAILLPLGIEELPENLQCFDTVFAMGVLYHRKSPFDFLRQLKLLLRKGGELVLETLTISGSPLEVLVPADRYARMRNVWFIPSEKSMCQWLIKAGFKNVRVVDSTATTVSEQRATEWSNSESLRESLCEENSNLTVEGYPAPVRTTFVAEKL